VGSWGDVSQIFERYAYRYMFTDDLAYLIKGLGEIRPQLSDPTEYTVA
jgi:hypothetical protein